MQSYEESVKCKTIGLFWPGGNTVSTTVGGKAKQATIDHHLSPEATARKAQANSEQVVSIVLDVEKVYDLTWRHGILMDAISGSISGLRPAAAEVTSSSTTMDYPK